MSETGRGTARPVALADVPSSLAWVDTEVLVDNRRDRVDRSRPAKRRVRRAKECLDLVRGDVEADAGEKGLAIRVVPSARALGGDYEVDSRGLVPRKCCLPRLPDLVVVVPQSAI